MAFEVACETSHHHTLNVSHSIKDDEFFVIINDHHHYALLRYETPDVLSNSICEQEGVRRRECDCIPSSSRLH